mmetsp:Transcript_15963/g.18558  ORF Transcript_15963/g.18558 Transcript_15963/m.18558 type:complete len:199 (-) Transcript_15963:19-615(-)
MSCICLGGVCIPYSAILPFLLIALQYIIKPLHKAGLIPDSIAKRLGLYIAKNTSATKSKEEKIDDSCRDDCCNFETAKFVPTGSSEELDDIVSQIESSEQYKTLLSEYETVILKFTAEWCKPCKKIHPVFVKLAETFRNQKDVKFGIVDVDEVDDVAAECKVSVLPAFVAFQNGIKCNQITGSDESKLESFVNELTKN